MNTPKNITELKREVRDYTARNPEWVSNLRLCADVDAASPDLFGWLRLWMEVRYQQGERIDPRDVCGTLNQDGAE